METNEETEASTRRSQEIEANIESARQMVEHKVPVTSENLKEALTQSLSGYDVELNSQMFSNVINLGISYDATVTEANVLLATEAPMTYNQLARKLSLKFYNSNGMYANIIDDGTSIPTLNKIITIRDYPKLTKEEHAKRLLTREIPSKLKKLIAKQKKVEDLADAVGHKIVSRDAMRTDLLDGMFVGILRNTKDSTKPLLSSANVESLSEIEALNIEDDVMIQPLDLDYCKVIGMFAGLQVAAFDMQYFDQFKYGGLLHEIKNFPKYFLSGYNAYKKDSAKRWMKLDPYTTMVLKFKAGRLEPYGRPYCLPAMREMQHAREYDDDQYALIRELASSIYTLEMPEGEKKGSCSLKKPQQENLIQGFKNAVLSNVDGTGKKVTTLSLPPNAKLGRMTKDASLIKDTLSDEFLKKQSTSLGVASAMFNGESQSGASFASLQVNIDFFSSQLYEIMDAISEEYTRLFNYYLFGEKTPSITFEYLPMTYLNRKEMFTEAKDLFAVGAGSRKYLIETSTHTSRSYISMMRQERDEGYEEEFTPHITSFTATDSADSANEPDNLGGKPPTPVGELTSQSSVSTKANQSGEG